jgi:Kef-type K+ transport system membrane component KefB
MPDVLSGLAWPAVLALAWIGGETGHRWLGLPRISGYGIVGFLLGASQGGWLPDPRGSDAALLADIAFGLILFELGYRINLRWLGANPWLGVTGAVEAAGSFAAVYAVAAAFGLPSVPALLIAALAMSTSPAAVLRVANELRSSGQVTERMLHLSALNCVLAVLAFKAVLGYWILSETGGLFDAIWNGFVVVAVSAGLGALFGVAVPALLRGLGGFERSATVAFALAVLVLTATTQALKFSPMLAALAFGIVARHRRVGLSQAQRNFGALGDLLTVLLFVFVVAGLDWKLVVAGLPLALAIVGARMAAKTATTTVFAGLGGVSWRKGFLTGVALTPLSVFALLLVDQTRHLHLDRLDDIAGVGALVLLLEVLGPLLTQWALVRAGETAHAEET